MEKFYFMCSIILYLSTNYCLSQTSLFKIKSDIMPRENIEDDFFDNLNIDPEIKGDKEFFRFYENQNNFMNNSNEKYFLGLAVFFKNKVSEIEAKIDIEIDKLINVYFKDDMAPEDVNIFEQKRDNIYNKYQDNISYFKNKSIEYWFHYRNLRNIQGPLIKGSDKALRTSLFYENNIINKKDKFLSSFGITFGKDNNVSIFSELYKDYMGAFRISLGTLISNNGKIENDSSGITVIDESERKDATIQRIIGGGGNFIGLISYPIFHVRSKGERTRFFSTLNSKPSVDVPMLGTISNDFNFNWYNYHEASLIISGLEGNIAFLFTNKFGHLLGNRSYYNYLNIDEENQIRNDGLFMHQLQIGVKFGDTFLISYSTFYGDQFVKTSFPNSISLSLIPR